MRSSCADVDEVLRTLCALVDDPAITAPDLYESVRDRKGAASTAVGNMVALPHSQRLVTECSHIKALVVEQSIDWKGKHVRVVLPASFSATDRQQGERLSDAILDFAMDRDRVLAFLRDPAPENLILLCAAGMSTSAVVAKMRKAVETEGFEADISAHTLGEAETFAAEADVILLGPQVSYNPDAMRGQRRRSYTFVTKCKSHERASAKLILQCWRAIRRGARAWQAMSNALSTNAPSQKTGRTHLGSDRLKDVARRLGASADTR